MNVLRNNLILGIVGMSLGVFFIGQDTGMSQTTDKDYCAVCHGMDGKGDGPAVQFLQAAPPVHLFARAGLTLILRDAYLSELLVGKRYNEKNVTLTVNAL
jgi:hypothetical protein